MKIGIEKTFHDGYTRWNDKQYEILKEHGFECLDIDFSNTDDWMYTEDIDFVEKKLLKEKALIENAGLEVSQVHGPWRFPPGDHDEQERAKRLAMMKKCVHLAKIIGSRYMVIHPIMPFGIEDKYTENENKTWDLNVEFMSELTKAAKEENIIVCVENMPFRDFSISTPSEILELVRMVDDDNFMICLDTGHANIFEGLTLGNCVRELGSKLCALHVHDNDGRADVHLPPFYGIADWKDFGRALNEIGFDGAVSLECNPPAKLSDLSFENMSRAYAQLAADIIF